MLSSEYVLSKITKMFEKYIVDDKNSFILEWDLFFKSIYISTMLT